MDTGGEEVEEGGKKSEQEAERVWPEWGREKESRCSIRADGDAG